ncbi:MAG: hypothetical protein MHM6MM_006699 [Cercozoa sp. M6MM]
MVLRACTCLLLLLAAQRLVVSANECDRLVKATRSEALLLLSTEEVPHECAAASRAVSRQDRDFFAPNRRERTDFARVAFTRTATASELRRRESFEFCDARNECATVRDETAAFASLPTVMLSLSAEEKLRREVREGATKDWTLQRCDSTRCEIEAPYDRALLFALPLRFEEASGFRCVVQTRKSEGGVRRAVQTPSFVSHVRLGRRDFVLERDFGSPFRSFHAARSAEGQAKASKSPQWLSGLLHGNMRLECQFSVAASARTDDLRLSALIDRTKTPVQPSILRPKNAGAFVPPRTVLPVILENTRQGVLREVQFEVLPPLGFSRPVPLRLGQPDRRHVLPSELTQVGVPIELRDDFDATVDCPLRFRLRARASRRRKGRSPVVAVSSAVSFQLRCVDDGVVDVALTRSEDDGADHLESAGATRARTRARTRALTVGTLVLPSALLSSLRLRDAAAAGYNNQTVTTDTDGITGTDTDGVTQSETVLHVPVIAAVHGTSSSPARLARAFRFVDSDGDTVLGTGTSHVVFAPLALPQADPIEETSARLVRDLEREIASIGTMLSALLPARVTVHMSLSVLLGHSDGARRVLRLLPHVHAECAWVGAAFAKHASTMRRLGSVREAMRVMLRVGTLDYTFQDMKRVRQALQQNEHLDLTWSEVPDKGHWWDDEQGGVLNDLEMRAYSPSFPFFWGRQFVKHKKTCVTRDSFYEQCGQLTLSRTAHAGDSDNPSLDEPGAGHVTVSPRSSRVSQRLCSLISSMSFLLLSQSPVQC